ncbi:hypothetical protein [Nonomuraea sp. CA-141351]|uniref:hypothetical protein n=1 Tax=Nonomuraea sp. CA-141351 TaxID=3239996 RepID=UPI003D8CEC00
MSQDSTQAETARTMRLPTLMAMVIGSMVGVGDFFDYLRDEQRLLLKPAQLPAEIALCEERPEADRAEPAAAAQRRRDAHHRRTQLRRQPAGRPVLLPPAGHGPDRPLGGTGPANAVLTGAGAAATRSEPAPPAGPGVQAVDAQAAVLPGRIVRSVHLPAAPLVLDDRAVTGGIPAYVAWLLTDLLVSVDRRSSS